MSAHFSSHPEPSSPPVSSFSMSSPPTSAPASTTMSFSPPTPMVRPTSHSVSLQRPLLAQDMKKTRNSKRLSLLVPPSPEKLETLASIAAASSPSFPPPSFSSPSFPPPSSLSARRHFTSAPLSMIPSQPPTAPGTPADTAAEETSTRRRSQLMLDQALPTPRLPISVNGSTQRPISAYFAEFSAECGTASPYTKEPVCVLPHLYLGAEHNATDIRTLARLGVTAVLNVAVEITASSQQQPSSPSRVTAINGDRIVKTMQGHSIHFKNLSWTHHQRNLQSEFPMAFAFIEETKNMGGKVLVHCQLGVSRSASLVIAYVMKALQMNLTDAYEFVKTRSSVISPNMSLMYQLAEFGKSLEKSATGYKANMASTYGAEDDEDVYPYPTDSMDIDEVEEKKESTPEFKLSPVSKSLLANSKATTTKRGNLVLARSNSRSGNGPLLDLAASTPTTTRPRSPYYRSPFAPITAEALNLDTPQKTPMMDRFSFSSMGVPPSTPMADRFSFSEAECIPPSTPMTGQFSFPEAEYIPPSTPLTDWSSFSHGNSIPPSTSMADRLSFSQYPEGVCLSLSTAASSIPLDLSPPVPLFLTSHRPPCSASSASSSSGSSFSTLPTFSRPSSSTSSASTAISICESPVTIAPTAVTPIVTSESSNRRSSGIWPKMPSTPLRLNFSGSSSSPLSNSASAASAHSPPQQPQSKKTVAIHTLAKALTRRWSNGLHGNQGNQEQQQRQQQPFSEYSTSGLESGIALAIDSTDDEIVGAAEGIENVGCSTSPEFIFSPRPGSPPPLLERKSFGEFYQALRMEG